MNKDIKSLRELIDIFQVTNSETLELGLKPQSTTSKFNVLSLPLVAPK